MKHTVILIPGLGDRARLLSFSVRNWEKKYHLHPIVHNMHWNDATKSYVQKFKDLQNEIDAAVKTSDLVSLVGVSAGGSAVITAFAQQPSQIHKVVNVCGRLRDRQDLFPTLRIAAHGNTSFIQSVHQSEKVSLSLSAQEKKKILVIRPQFGDEVVPALTSTLDGAINTTVPMISHPLGIMYVFLFPERIVEFLTS